MNKFYINLDDSVERKTKFDNTWTRWSATGRNQVDILTRKKMISYYNVSEAYHLGKCGCFLSHIKLLKYIVENKLIGTYQVAEALLNELLSNKRYRAIDIMYINSKLNKQYLYPALFVEERVDSTIRKGKRKYSNEYYNLN